MIRVATIDDAEELANCHRASILSVSTEHYSKEQLSAWAERTVPQKYLSSIGRQEIFVEEDASKIQGLVWIQKQPAQIVALYISPSSQRKGLGSRLLMFAETTIKSKEADLITVKSSLQAVGFYQRHGYAEISRASLTMGTVQLPYISMVKILS